MPNLDLRANPEKLSKGAFEKSHDLVIGQQVSSSQFRKYFGEIKDIQRQFENGQIDWENVRLRLHLLKARLAYSLRKDGGRAGKGFYRFFDDTLNEAINGANYFKEALLFIEAVLAYFYPLEELFKKIKDDRNIPQDKKHTQFTEQAKREFLGGAE